MKILVLGARSWIGYRLYERAVHNSWAFHGTSSSESDFDFVNHICLKPEHFSSLITTRSPDVVVNLLRGEDKAGAQCFEATIQASANVGAYYVYASSALALDGYEDVALTDDLEARSVSEYGKFKGSCENVLLGRSDLTTLVLRFSSIHGWSPCRASRSESLLQKLQNGESISVQRGVVQNRLSDVRLAEHITKLISNRREGIVHLGASDSSQEHEFLANLAEAFGYSADSIKVEGQRDVNLALVPSSEAILDLPIESEQHTLQALLNTKELEQFKKTS